MTFYINEFEISKYLIQTYFTDGRLKLMQEFDAEFELVEYREEFYNSRHELITEKIFYAESWTIHEEDLI